ncbi:proteasome subunit beta type-4 [Diorhabda carinulata]|uniref:proteasome subunit beta type-4 n=1 Tax=Diorhabda sublineata TaxID=1163346 RepID=UPI0024E0E78B|nr:proteasome subunit beta type-4 [Diorhabda sublineata]XP_057653835.1 proteasome subunit beta type-4 [Diorhabda carinulata]
MEYHLGSAPPLWNNGPIPGKLYNFPGTKATPKTFTQSPVTTSTSIIAITYDKGVLVAGDLVASYGSLARYRNCPRVIPINQNIILGAGGDYADFQYVKSFIEQKIIDEECIDDGLKMKPKSLYCWLTRVMYQRRSKLDPFWNNLVIGGLQDGVPFLGTVDKLGTAYTDKTICTGYGAHIALPILRETLDKNPEITLNEAKDLIHKCMEVLFYRDARSYPKYQLGIIDKDEGVKIEGPLSVQQNWDIALMT